MRHSYLMVGLLVVGAALFFSGIVNARVLFLLWPLACVVMMVVMMRAMMSMGRGNTPAGDVDRDHAQPPVNR